MQISDMGVAFIMQALALILAILSIFLTDYLKRRTGRMASRKIRVSLWMVFVIVASGLLIFSSILMIDSTHYLEITAIIVTCIFLGIGGFISLSKYSVNQNPIISE